MKDETEGLLPCPFCGGTTFVLHGGRVGCINGMCDGGAPKKAWNTRVAPAPRLTDEELDALWYCVSEAAYSPGQEISGKKLREVARRALLAAQETPHKLT